MYQFSHIDSNGKYVIEYVEEHKFRSVDKDFLVRAIREGVKIVNLPKEVLEDVNNGNRNQVLAKRNKNDEFYTRIDDIDRELKHYAGVFKDKVIYCPTDVAIEDGYIRKSNFVYHFQERKEKYNFKKLVATCLAERGDEYNNKYILERKETENGIEWVETFEQCAHDIDRGYSSGDYRSSECMKLLSESDIVVTNPPFSIFIDFFKWIMNAGKDMLIIGALSNVSYNDIFPYFRDEMVRFGARKHDTIYFHTSDEQQKYLREHKNKGSWLEDEQTHEIYAGVPCMWYTTLRPDTREQEAIIPTATYYGNESKYPMYQNCDAIEVSRVVDIPKDYDGLMGVPVTYFDKANDELFEVVGNSKLDARPFEVGGRSVKTVFFINNKAVYTRILIRKRRPKEAKFSIGTNLILNIDGRYDTLFGEVVDTNGEEYFVDTFFDGKAQRVSSKIITDAHEN